MKVSLIVPAYNEEAYLPKLLKSITTQSRLPDEVIICNNASTDKTVEVASKFSESLPLRIISQPTKGILPTVELAWRQATGDVILRTDADCILPPDWVGNMVNHFISDPELSAVGGYFRASDGNYVYRLFSLPIAVLNNLSIRLARGFWILYGGNFGIRRHILESIDGYRTGPGYIQDDILLSQKLHQHHYKYKFFPDCLNYTSTRRFNSFRGAVLSFASGIINSSFYIEKSS